MAPVESTSNTLNEQSPPTSPASELGKLHTTATFSDCPNQASTSTATSSEGQNDLLNTSSSRQNCEQDTDSALVALQRSLSLPNSWIDASHPPLTSLCLCKVSTIPTVSTQPSVITHSLIVNENLGWELYVHNRQVQPHALRSVPLILTSESLNNLLQLLERPHVCGGQPDSHFVSMVNAKNGKIISSSNGKVAAIVDQYAPVAVNREYY